MNSDAMISDSTGTEQGRRLYGRFASNDAPQSFSDENLIGLNDAAGIQMVRCKDILRCEADRAYCIFHLTNGSKIKVSRSLKFFEDKLVEWNFIRVHKSNLVNPRHIVRYLRNIKDQVVLTDKSKIDVSTRKRTEVIHAIKRNFSLTQN